MRAIIETSPDAYRFQVGRNPLQNVNYIYGVQFIKKNLKQDQIKKAYLVI